MKIKLTFENGINCLEPTQFENKINHIDNSKIVICSLKKGRKIIKKKEANIKTQQRFRGKQRAYF